jgi:hypothetical protein
MSKIALVTYRRSCIFFNSGDVKTVTEPDMLRKTGERKKKYKFCVCLLEETNNMHWFYHAFILRIGSYMFRQ